MEQWTTARHRDLAVALSLFHPKVFVYVKTVVSLLPQITPCWEDKDTHTHSLGAGPGPEVAQSRDKEIEAQRQEA